MATTSPSTRQELVRLPLARIIPAPDNDREELGDLADLTKSVGEHGFDQSPKVTRHTSVAANEWLTVFGHRRLAAAKKAGQTEVEVIVAYGDNPVGGLTDDEIERQRGEENLNRVDLTPGEEARVYARRARKVNPATGRRYTVQEVADFYSRNQSLVSKRIALTLLEPEVLTLVDQGVLSAKEGYYLSQLHEHPGEIRRVVDAFVRGVLGVGIEQAVKDSKAELGVVSRGGGRPARKAQPEPAPPAAVPVPAAVRAPAPEAPPVMPRPRGTPVAERTHIALQVRVTRPHYERAVRARLHGGRFGLSRYWAGQIEADIDANTPPEVAEEGEPAPAE
jgi:ParB/RepB/Spo0J family partition protein